MAEVLRNTARDVLGETSGKGGRADRDTWWCKKEVQDSVKAKKEAKKLWDFTRDEVIKERYKRARKKVKREVAKAKNDTYEELYQRLEMKEGEMELFKIAKQRDRRDKDVHQAESHQE